MNIRERLKMENYTAYVQKEMPKSHTLLECLRAFLVGGAICCLGQGLRNFAADVLRLDEGGTAAFTSIVLIFLGALLTGLGVYDVLGRFAGAGSIVPITGFSNSVVSPALEFRAEGYILGVGAKLFTVAGPVLVYGISSSTLVGLVYFLAKCLGWA